jgi:UDP-N-acetylglucosamine 2-epimerase (non-hydrolysing)
MAKKRRICIILGTRPEIIKLSPIIRLCQKRKLNYFILHTGQHYSYNMDHIFFKELRLPKPKYNLKVGSGSHAEEIGNMLIKIEKILKKEKPDVVLVQGDTNSVLAGTLAANKLGIKIGHVEAGLRSYDETMPEEINRKLTDHMSDYLFCPTQVEKKILLNEGVKQKKIFVTGNTIVDSVMHNIKLAEKKKPFFNKLGLDAGKYFLATIHRPSNTDVKKNLKIVLSAMSKLYKKYDLPVVCPLHPRTVKKIKSFKIKIPEGVKVMEPIGYLEFLYLEQNAKLIITDSGGVEEEACILEVPCITLRTTTERPETVKVGANMLAGDDIHKIMKDAKIELKKCRNWKDPLGDGKASEKILRIIK